MTKNLDIQDEYSILKNFFGLWLIESECVEVIEMESDCIVKKIGNPEKPKKLVLEVLVVPLNNLVLDNR